MADEQDKKTDDEEIAIRSGVPKVVIGGGVPHSDARCDECGVMPGREHLAGCKYA
jgi:hypothetical protein